ncbi:Cof-type HAD-IIB family hydrolase [[Mycoplasma] mobile]|uniref:COF family HAD hydrolase protein n=1 Tax=Mycoplasma mobile (strain ATCC 43663 / 163K / NCTC 11711) TaxID=267748 RepID=Q6KIP4_MYCM1|nr:Cof-type HAD-IIB family hydrolase [[Mycoplasma] mobile]AAT27532.1 COF family HAD hydrolase protein [Mycoplasma mobile 163K]
MDKNLLTGIKAFYFDLDGTTFVNEKEIDSSTLRVFETLKQKGFKVGIATGRHHLEIQEQLEKIKPNLPVITVNGTMMLDPQSKKVLNINNFNIDEGEEILKIIEKNNVLSCSFTNEEIIYSYNEDLNEDLKVFEQEYEISLKTQYPIPYVFLDKNEKRKNLKINKFLLFGKNLDEKKYKNIKKDIETSGIDAQILYAYNNFIEIFPRKTSKASSLALVAKNINWSLDSFGFFGDGVNDIEICKAAKLCVAMGNSWKELKSVATVETKTNLENGIEFFFKKIELL